MPEPTTPTPAPSDPTPAQPAAVADHRAALAVEYGTYRAIEPIHYFGTLAFNPGDPVPVSHVKNGVVLKSSVEKVTDK